MIRSHDRYRSKSATPVRTQNGIQYSNSSPKSPKFDPAVQNLIESLRTSLNQIQQAVQLHSKLNQNGMAQRCLVHNNAISLYCCNQHRLICVNCVYSGNKHKAHKVIPTSEANPEITKDLSSHTFRLAQKMDELEKMQKTANQNMELVKNAQTVLISKLDKQFDEVMRHLSSKYLELKTDLKQYFDEFYQANKTVGDYLKNVCTQVESALDQMDGTQKKPDDSVSGSNMYKHLVLSRMIDNLLVSGQLNRADRILENIEAQAHKQMSKLKAELVKHKWAKVV